MLPAQAMQACHSGRASFSPTCCISSENLCPCCLQITKLTAAHELVSHQLADTEQALKERSEQLKQTAASLEVKITEFARLSQQHQALVVQHERTEGELSDLTGVLRAKQKDAEALQQR